MYPYNDFDNNISDLFLLSLTGIKKKIYFPELGIKKNTGRKVMTKKIVYLATLSKDGERENIV